MLLAFPTFNLYSTPLLVLVSQGLLFGFLLCQRAGRERRISDLFLGLLVLVTCYHRTTYTIGFMDWYDTNPTTKVNYWLVPFTFSVPPLIYLYLKSIAQPNHRFSKADLWHFLPQGLTILYRCFIFLYDAAQPGFDAIQEGVLWRKWNMGIPGAAIDYLETVQQVVYLSFTFQLYFRYRSRLKEFYSNTYDLELRWMLHFLLVYSFLFLYGSLQQVIDLSVHELSWIQKWWKDFLSALAVVYIGIKGYFAPPTHLAAVGFGAGWQYPAHTPKPAGAARPGDIGLSESGALLHNHMASQQAYLDPDLNLSELASQVGWSRSRLSEVINQEFGLNFNDFVNDYRNAHVKRLIREGRHRQYSLLGIAFESGFRSKATFNRVFQKLNGMSPSTYAATLSGQNS